MNVQFDCYPCIFAMLVKLTNALKQDDETRRELMNVFLGYLKDNGKNITPPELASFFYTEYNHLAGCDDHYADEKIHSTNFALQLYDNLARHVSNAGDPFTSAVKFAIAGNIIDYGATPDFNLAKAEKEIMDIAHLPLDTAAANELKQRVGAAGKILYILDNCGEAVLDRLLLEQFAEKVTLAVRGKAIFNDITRQELSISKLDKFRCIDTGDNTPGVSLSGSTENFVREMREADLIIAKGQGNFESLEGCWREKPIFFLFRVKCPVISKYINAPAGSLQLIGRNL